MKVYLAGPDVFFREPSDVADKKRDACRKFGFHPLHPLDNSDAGGARAIYRSNVALLHRADLVIANLTPFRGVSADAGTVFEVGYAAARGLRVYGYSNDGRPLARRVAPALSRRGVELLAPDGMLVEDFGLGENLMVAEAIILSGGAFLTPPNNEVRSTDDLALFDDCLRLATASALAATI
jgi:nucleoside 2-deoxyribosyltransferase